MATLNSQALKLPSLTPTFAAAASGGDQGPTGPTTFLVVKNSNAATRTVTVVVPGNDWNSVAAPDTVVTVPVTPGEVWIPLDARYSDPTSGRAVWTYSTEVSLTVAVIALG